MRPDERHGRTRWPAKEQLFIGNICSLPDLFGKQPFSAGKGFQGNPKLLSFFDPPRSQFIVGPLSGQQGPGPTDPGTVKWLAIHMLAVTVAVVTSPDRTVRGLHLQQC